MIIDATDLIVGRIGTFVAKKVLLGESVNIVNCGKAVVSGKKNVVFAGAMRKVHMGTPAKGPIFHRDSAKYVKRVIRGMLPYKRERGLLAYKRIMCYAGVPDQFKNQKFETIPSANVLKLPNINFVDVATICKHIGGK